MAAAWNPYGTDIISWVDIGLYRQLVEEDDFTDFYINPPKDFDETKVSQLNVELFLSVGFSALGHPIQYMCVTSN